ncbi:MAG: ArsA family ATPase, partial [Planctomycetales bacterium]
MNKNYSPTPTESKSPADDVQNDGAEEQSQPRPEETDRQAVATRVLLYTGKGGVGKTTVAAGTALLAAQSGLRTLITSIDSAHNLGDLLGQKVRSTPTSVAPGLDALEVDVNQEIQENWSAVIDFFRNLTFSSSLANQVVAEECAILPGMEEVFGLTRLRKLAATGDYDLIVVDSPPTGDMLKILRMPDVLDWFMRKYYPLEKKIASTMRPLVGKMAGVPIPEESYYQTVEDTYQQVQQVSDLLMDHRRSSLRLVMNPDSISLNETKRAYATVSLFGF